MIGEQCGRDLRQIPAEHVDRAECAVAVNDLDRARHRIGALQQNCDRVDLVGRLFVAVGAGEVVANDLVAFDLDEHICFLQEPILLSRHCDAVGDKADLHFHRVVEGVVVDHRGELFHSFFRLIILGEPDRQLARLAVCELDERRAREHRIVSAFPIVFRVREEHVRVDVQLARVARRRVGIAEPHLGDHVLNDVDRYFLLLPIVVFAVLFLVESDRRGRRLCRVVTDVIELEAGLGDLRGDVDRLAVVVAVLFVVRDRRSGQGAGAVAARQDIQIDVVRVDLDRIEVVVLQQLRHLRPDVDVDRDRLLERAFADRAGDRTRDRAHVGGIIRPLRKRGCKSFGSGPSALSAVDVDRGSRTVFIVEEQHLGRKRRDRCVFFRQRVQVDHHRHAFGTDQFHHRTVEVLDLDRSRYAAGERDLSVDFASLDRIDCRLDGSDVPVCDRRRTDRPCRAVGKMHCYKVRHSRVCVQRQVVDRHDTAHARVFDLVGKRQDLQIDLDLALQSSAEVRRDRDRQLVAVVCTRGACSRHLEQQVRIVAEHFIHIAAIRLTSKLELVECECHIGADNARAVLISRRLAREVFGHEGREVAWLILIRFKDDRLGDLAPVDYTRLRTRNDVAQRAYRRELVIDPDLHRVFGVPVPAVVHFAVGTLDILHASVIAGDIDVRERAVHEVEARIELVEHRHRQDRRHERPEDVFKDVVDRRADHTEQRRQVDADRVDDRRRGHDVGDDVVLDACREIVPESVVSAPFDVAQMVLPEHLGSKLAEVEDRIDSKDLVHQVVDQFVDRVGVERDVRVERTGRVELDVYASGEQIHDVETVEQALQLGQVKSALFRRSGFFLRRSRRFAARAAARAAVRAAARAAARLFGRRAVDAVLEVADESVEERSDHSDHAFARIRFDGAVAVVVSDLDVEVLIVEDAADVDEAAQHSDPARLGIDRDRAGVVVEHRIDETVHAALRVFVLSRVDLPDRDQECARGRSLTAGVGKHLLRAHLFDAHSEISEAVVRFECTVADVKRQIEVEVVEQALGDARAARTVDDRRVGADIDRVVFVGVDLLLREHHFVDSVLTDRERELCAEGDVVVDGKVKQQLAVDHVEFDAQADVDAEAEARKASDDLVDGLGREFDKQRGVVRRNTLQQRL